MLSTLITIITVPYVRQIGYRFGVIDEPDPRKMHSSPIVRLGGLSIVFSFLITCVIYFLFFNYQNFYDLETLKSLIVILIASLLAFLLGMLDDIFIISYWKRLFFQILISSFIWINGVAIKNIDISAVPFFSEESMKIDNSISYIVTILWFSGITNSINWMDGLDGLAAGITVIISLGLAIFSIFNGNLFFGLLAIILTGSCIGFLKNNSYPSTIMMGDGGSYFLGSLLASLSIVGLQNANNEIDLFLILILFFIPISDMCYVIFSRIKSGLSPFYPDRRHLHHRLIRYGFSYRKTVLLIYLLNFLTLIFSFFYFN